MKKKSRDLFSFYSMLFSALLGELKALKAQYN